jgi:hypothetical protein
MSQEDADGPVDETDGDESGNGNREHKDDPIAGMYDDPDSNPSPVRPGEAYDDDGDDDNSTGLTGPMAEEPEEPETRSGVYYVKYAEDRAVTLHNIETAEICTLVENPGLEAHEIIEATLIAQPPMEVSYLIKDLDDHYTIDVETSPEPPTARVMDIADQMDEDGVVAIEREGNGEIHILKVAPDDVERIANSLDDDEKPYKNAVDVGVDYVEVRSDADEGVISIRYLP